MRIDYLTIFPEMFSVVLNTSILARAREKGAVEYRYHDIRDFISDKHKVVDDKPFGGEAGMVMKAEPIDNALDSILAERENTTILLTDAAGVIFTQEMAKELAENPNLCIICGRYKGVDERIKELYDIIPVSIGDYVISGGELASLVITEAVVRLLPGVLGDMESASADSFFDGLLSSPVYTRPAEYKGLAVPEELLSGNHAHIEKWRQEQALKRTRKLRPDLYRKYKNAKKVLR